MALATSRSAERPRYVTTEAASAVRLALYFS
jgi:hypothetical protein